MGLSKKTMNLVSINVSQPREIAYNQKTLKTGIFKEPVFGRVQLRSLGLDGDGQADLKNHGGVNRAVYVYTIENYEYWKKELERDYFPYGQFGENFTVEGMLEDQIHIGDVFRIGGTLMEVTQPRVPCFKLGMKMNLDQFPKLFLASGRIGFYLRVLKEGEVKAGDRIHRVKIDPSRMTVHEVSHLLHFGTKNIDEARRALSVQALSPGWRESFEKIIASSGV